MTDLILYEGQRVRLYDIIPSTMSQEAALLEVGRKSQVLKNALKLRAGPLAVHYEDGFPTLQITGIAGSARLFGNRVEILPKFGDERSWHENISILLARAYGTKFHLQELQGTSRDRLNFIDHVAFAFANALEGGLLDGPITTYRDFEHRASVAKGRIDIRRTVTAVLRSPGTIFSQTSELDADNPYNRLLHAAADALLRLVENRDIRNALSQAREALPPLPQSSAHPSRWPDRPPVQFAGYTEALEIAAAVLQGRDWGISSAVSTAFGYIVAMEKLFENFVENTLKYAVDLLPPSLNATSRGQVRTVFAEPRTLGRRAYYTQPDNVIDVQARPTVIVDAKYKRFADAETGDAGRPSNSDVYQMFASMAAQGCRVALLIYPTMTDLKEPSPTWHMKIGSEDAFVAAAGLPMSELRRLGDLGLQDKLLAQHCANLIALAHQKTESTLNVA